MLKHLIAKIKESFRKSRMTEYERYLSQAVDLADLEHRMKYGRNMSTLNVQEQVRTNLLYLTRGF